MATVRLRPPDALRPGADALRGKVNPPSFTRRVKAGSRLEWQRDAFTRKLNVLRGRAVSSFKSGLVLSDLEVGRTLGVGNFGRVHVVSPSASGRAHRLADGAALPKFMALKVQEKAGMAHKPKELEHARDEKNLTYAMEHRNLVGVIEYFQDARSLYFLLELCNAGELWSIIQASKNRRLQPKVALFWGAQVASAFEYMHNLDIIYRDLKPENLLVDHKGYLKITDFGFAKRITDRTWTLCGTPEYIAPEVIRQKGYNHSADWWGFGILLFEMSNGDPPFVADSQMKLFALIQKGIVAYPRHFHPKLMSLIQAFLVSNPSDRLGYHMHEGMAKIKGSPYFASINWAKLEDGTAKSPFIVKAKGEGDCSAFDAYDEEKLVWHGDKPDGYGKQFEGF